MSSTKLTVIYYSMTGNNHQLATWAANAAEEAGAEVRLRKVKELAPQHVIDANPAWKAHNEATKDVPEASMEDLEWADALIFSSPTRFGNVASQIKQFFDLCGGLWARGELANKVVSAMSSAQNAHGGQEQTILQLYTSMYHWGAIVVAPGYTDPSLFAAGGNPYGTSATIGEDGKIVDSEQVRAAVAYQAGRVVDIATRLKISGH